MLSAHKAVKHNFEPILGSRRGDLLQQSKTAVVKRDGRQALPNTTEARNVDTSEKSVKTVRVGAIKFQNIPIPKSAPTDLLCEECEKTAAVLFCRRCDEVICMVCIIRY